MQTRGEENELEIKIKIMNMTFTGRDITNFHKELYLIYES